MKRLSLFAGSAFLSLGGLNPLAGTLKNCASCHALYQIQAPVINDKH